jgi:hypothetical protein
MANKRPGDARPRNEPSSKTRSSVFFLEDCRTMCTPSKLRSDGVGVLAAGARSSSSSGNSAARSSSSSPTSSSVGAHNQQKAKQNKSVSHTVQIDYIGIDLVHDKTTMASRTTRPDPTTRGRLHSPASELKMALASSSSSSGGTGAPQVKMVRRPAVRLIQAAVFVPLDVSSSLFLSCGRRVVVVFFCWSSPAATPPLTRRRRLAVLPVVVG